MAMDAEPGRHGEAFSHRVVPGRAGRSYGLRVAAMEGVPDAVPTRAEELFAAGEAQGRNRAAIPAQT